MDKVMNEIAVRRFTIEEYNRMAETGVLSRDEHVELLQGLVCEMSPEGKRHVAAIELTHDFFTDRLRGKHRVRAQHPLTLAEGTEAEPDIAIVETADPRAYLDSHPTAALLVIEISETSLEKDCTLKADLYARAGISEYWVLNLTNDTLEVFRDPSESHYLKRQTLNRGEKISPVRLPDISVGVVDLLP